MAKPPRTPSYLVGRTTNRSNVEFAVSDKPEIAEIQEEVQSLSDFSAVPLIPLELIDSNPFQYRRRMDPKKLEELKNEMRRGITSVIVGRRNPDNTERIQIAYGHRRCEAARQLHAEGVDGFTGYPILIKDLTDQQMRLLPISENRFREDPSLVDEAYAFKSLIASGGYTQETAAEYYSISRGTFREILALADDESDIQEMVEAKSDTLRAARDIRKIEDPGIRAQVIRDLLESRITGTQVPSHIQTLQQAKQKHIQEEQEGGEKEIHQEPASTSVPVLSSLNETEHVADRPTISNDLATAIPTNIAKSDVPVGDGIETERDANLYKETEQRSATLIEQSRLRTWYKTIEGYGTRLDKRIRNEEVIPEEEAGLLRELYQLVVSQVEKLNR